MLDHQRVLSPWLDMMKINKLIGTWNTRTLFEAGKLDNSLYKGNAVT